MQTTDTAWRGYSLAERDRRWQAVRAAAAQADLDGMLVPLCMNPAEQNLSSTLQRGVRADGRYLTQIETGAIVLPTDGRAPVAIGFRPVRNEWLPEVRAPHGMWGSWGQLLADAVLELDLARGRIGVAGLQRGRVTHVSEPHGVVNCGAYAMLLQRLPEATFVDATDLVGFVRYVKSDEEVEALRRAVAIAEAGIDELLATARPGAYQATVHAGLMGRLLSLGSEYYAPTLEFGSDDGEGLRANEPVPGRQLQAGQVLHADVGAIWGGLIAEETQPLVLGPVPHAWQPAIALHQALFAAGLAQMRPGTTFGELEDCVARFDRERAQPQGLHARFHLQGRGVGDDGPLLAPGYASAGSRELRLERGNAFAWKPEVASADGRVRFAWGGTVVVTDQGAERLFQRSHGMVAIT